MIVDIALNTQWDAAFTEIDGAVELVMAYDHRAIGQLHRSRLLAQNGETPLTFPLAIDWIPYLEPNADYSLLGSKIRAVVLTTEGNAGADFSEAEYETDGGLRISGICPYIQCKYATKRIEISL